MEFGTHRWGAASLVAGRHVGAGTGEEHAEDGDVTCRDQRRGDEAPPARSGCGAAISG